MGSLHLQAGGPQKLTFYSAGRKGNAGEDVVKGQAGTALSSGSWNHGCRLLSSPRASEKKHRTWKCPICSQVLPAVQATDPRREAHDPEARGSRHRAPLPPTSVKTSSQRSNTYPRPFFSPFSFPPSSALALNPRCCTDQDGA